MCIHKAIVTMESHGLSAMSIPQKSSPRYVATRVGGMAPAASIVSVGSKGAQRENQYFCKLQKFEVLCSFCGRFFH